MIKNLLLVITSVLVLVGCGNNGESGEGENTADEAPSSGGGEISFSTWANEGEPAYVGMERFKEIVEEETDYQVSLFPANQLGSTAEQMEQVMMGSIEMMSSGDPGKEEIEMLSLPYLMDSNAHWRHVLESEIGQEWNEQLKEEQGLINIGTLPRGPRIISANTEINTPDDLAGMNIRAPERDYYVETFRALGASPTPVDFGELYSAIDTGIVEAQENPLETIVSAGFMEIQSHISLTNHMYKPAFITVNNDFFESLTEEEQDVFYEAALEADEVAGELLIEEEEETLQELEEDGIIQRKSYNEMPPKVVYSVTEEGKTLKEILVAMSDWGERRVDLAQQNGELIEILNEDYEGFLKM